MQTCLYVRNWSITTCIVLLLVGATSSKKGKGRYGCSWEPHLRATGRHLPHSVTCYPTQVNTPRPNTSHAGWYSIYLPWRDGRLSWPSWLDSAPAGSWTSDLLITSLITHTKFEVPIRGLVSWGGPTATLGTDVSRLPAQGCGTAFQLVLGKQTSAMLSSVDSSPKWLIMCRVAAGILKNEWNHELSWSIGPWRLIFACRTQGTGRTTAEQVQVGKDILRRQPRHSWLVRSMWNIHRRRGCAETTSWRAGTISQSMPRSRFISVPVAVIC